MLNTRGGPTVQLTKNETMSATITGDIPLESSLSAHENKAHIFDGLHSASLIYLGQMFDGECVAILENTETNILKGKTLILKGHKKRNMAYGTYPYQHQ